MYMYVYVRIYVRFICVCIYIYILYAFISMAMSRNPAPEDPRQQPSVTKACNAGLVVYPLSQFVARLKMIKNGNTMGGLSRQAPACYIPFVTGYVASVGPRPVTNLWF